MRTRLQPTDGTWRGKGWTLRYLTAQVIQRDPRNPNSHRDSFSELNKPFQSYANPHTTGRNRNEIAP
jgi:hypothetical protein